MKKLTGIIVVVIVVISVILPGTVRVSAAALPTTDVGTDKAADDRSFAGFQGRLSIPDAGINVALYNSMSQSVCDRWDSACLFDISPYYGHIIADHSNQEFSTLPSVAVGTIGQIQTEDGTVITIRCAEAFDGHNTGDDITDANGNIVFGQYDYLTYTCINGWRNVRVCQWEII